MFGFCEKKISQIWVFLFPSNWDLSYKKVILISIFVKLKEKDHPFVCSIT